MLLDDLLNDINAYPADNVVITITNFQGPGSHVNINEVWSFNVRVQNNGQLNLRNLQLHIEGSQWASVRLGSPVGCLPDPFGFSNSVVSTPQDVDAHSTVTFGPFCMRANVATANQGQVNEDLFSVHIYSYDANLSHILNGHSHHTSNPEARKHLHIHPV